MTSGDAAGTSITLRACAKTFEDGTRALEPINLEIEAGETMVLLGPSGCGKTTTLRIIAGLEEPDPGGSVLFNSDDVTAQPIERRNVGMVFQSYALFPNMNVEENIAYGLKVRRLQPAHISERVAEMLDMMQIGELKERRIDQLSGGQRQRVALARAIAIRPRALLLDEPLTALDALLRERLRVDIDALLRSLRITAVYVTHDQAEAMALGDRIVVMSRGRVAQIGRPREVYHSPANAFVADFIGTMNRLSGRARNGRLEVAGGVLPWTGRDDGPVEVLFRPEAVSIVAADQAQLTGRVAASFFLGDRCRLVIEDMGRDRIIVETSGRLEHAQGDRVHLRLEPRELLVIR
jgi:putative spermidine/putrescine transport system ATP-binding protein